MPAASARRPRGDATTRAYGTLVSCIGPLMVLIPPGTNVDLRASGPTGTPEPQALPPEAAALVRAKVLPRLAALDASLALERDPDAGVWETLVLEGHGHSGKACIGVVNAIGRRERVTTFGTARGLGPYLSGWSRAREATEDLGTSWDLARRERRVVDYGGEPSLVDRGVNRICDILAALGREPYATCEGHPWGAYVAFRPALDAAVGAEFVRLGWTVEDGGSIVRMPEVATGSDRDAAWRALCGALERVCDIGVPTEADERPSGP